MKSIQTKFIALILSCVLMCAVVSGGAGVINSQLAIDKDSAEIMNLMCSDKTKELNALLAGIEQSVETLALYTFEQLESIDLLKTDAEYMNSYTKKLESVAISIANNTNGALAVYVRYNPEFAPPTSGLFWSKTEINGTFQPLTPTDFSVYSPDDVEHVGWYYIPVKNAKATWITPYLNKNINEYMISYVIPIYRNNETVGVVGMDIDFNLITDSVASMQAYNTGYAFLTDSDANVMFHKDMPVGASMSNTDNALLPVVHELKNGTSGSSLFSYKWRGQEKKLAFRTLVNGMTISVTAPAHEIHQARNNLIVQICIAVILVAGFSIFLTIALTRRIIRPLRELTTAAKKIADGDLGISLTYQTKDEIGILADSFQQTVGHLQQYIEYINGLAYRDALTGIKNNTAYQDAAKRLEEQIRSGQPDFAVIVFDINGLKYVNDTYGHDFGDMLIIDSCRIICRSFKKSPVYRIGGDEFVAILEGDDYVRYSELLQEFEDNIIEVNKITREDCQISIARGIAVYSPETDLVFANVFKRADDAMYQNKIEMKRKIEETKDIAEVVQ